MLLYYIRHGEPIYEPDQLTELGHIQAAALAKRLSGSGIQKIYTSTSNRAIQTALPLCRALDMEPQLLEKLSLFNSEFDDLASAAGGAFRLNEAFKMAATLLSISPRLLMYAFVQRKFIEGIENTGITGE